MNFKFLPLACSIAISLSACSITGVDRSTVDRMDETFYASLVSTESTSVQEGSTADNDGYKYRFYHPQRGDFSVMSRSVLEADTSCVEVTVKSKVELVPVEPSYCESENGSRENIALYGVHILPSLPSSQLNTLYIQDGMITDILPASEQLKLGFAFSHGEQQWVVPGLIDGHVHLSQSGSAFTRPDMIDATGIFSYQDDQIWLSNHQEQQLSNYLKMGVSTIVDLGGPTSSLSSIVQLECATCPTVLASGALISASSVPTLQSPEGETFVQANSADEAVSIVTSHAQQGASIAKFVWTSESGLSPEDLTARLKPAMLHASDLGLVVAAHTQDLEYAKAAIRAGADAIVHGVMTSELDQEFIHLAKENNVAYMPTLTAYDHYLDIFLQQLSFTELESTLADDYVVESFERLNSELTSGGQMLQLVVRYLPFVDQRADERSQLTAQEQAIVLQLESIFSEQISRYQRDNLLAAVNAGLRVGLGTDAGNPGTLHGLSLLEEMNAWRSAGVPASQIVQALTETNAETYGLEQQGTIAVGNAATFNLLNANPLENLAALVAPTRVFISGREAYSSGTAGGVGD